MQLSTALATALAPIVGGGMWWLYMYPGRKVRTALDKRLPEGRLRRVLLYKIPGTDESKP